MSLLDSFCASLLQERGCGEFVIVRDDHAPTAKLTPRNNNKALLPDNRPPMCPKRKESSDKLSTIESNNKKVSSSQKINSLKDFFDEITKPGESRSRKEIGDCRISPSKTSLKNNPWSKCLDEGPTFPLKRRGSQNRRSSHDDVAALSAKNSPWDKFHLDDGPNFPLKRRGIQNRRSSHGDMATFSACVCGNQSKNKKSLQVVHTCGEARIGVPYDMMSPRSARWSARPAIFQKKV
jgi:hypothetical protein